MDKDLREVFKVGQNIIYLNKDFDAIKKRIQCTVLEVSTDSMTILDIETDTKLYIERDFNLDCIETLDNNLFSSAVSKMYGN